MKNVMKMMVLSAVLLFVGCATTAPNVVSTSVPLSPDSTKSLVVISTTETGFRPTTSAFFTKGYWRPFLWYKQQNEGLAGVTIDWPKSTVFQKNDFGKNSGIHGSVEVLHLAPGEYEIFNWTVLMSGSASGYTNPAHEKHRAIISNTKQVNVGFKSEQEFSKKFTVKANEVVYIGEIGLHFIQDKNYLGFVGVVGGAEVFVKDAQNRDLEIAKAKYPNIDFNHVVARIASDN